MEGAVLPPRLDEFMRSALVTWVRTFVPLDGDMNFDFSVLLDGVFLNDVMTQINPSATPAKKVSRDPSQRTQNLNVLVQRIKTYYQDNLRQFIMIPLPNVLLLGRTPYCEQSPEEMNKLLMLLLGCAVQCEEKEEYIERIQTLDFETKAAIAALQQRLEEEWTALSSTPPRETGKAMGEWLRESQEATKELLKLKDRLIEVERNNATLEAERQAMQAQLRQLENQSDSQQAQVLALQRQAATLQENNTALQTLNANLQVEKYTLNSQSASLMASKDLFHVEERQYIDNLNDLRRQNERLEEKIMDQYKFYEPLPPRRRGNWFALKMKKLIKSNSHEHGPDRPPTPTHSGDAELHLSNSSIGSDGSGASGATSAGDAVSPQRNSNLP